MGTRHRISASMVATGVAVLMIAQQIAAKAVRDALFLSEYPATSLPRVMVTAAVVAFVTITAVSRWMLRRSPAAVVPKLFCINAALFLGEWVLVLQQPGIAATVVYVHTAALGAALISSFWSVINERWDPRSAKRAVAVIAAGAALGGMAGGGAAWVLGTSLSLSSVLPALALTNVLCALGVVHIDRATREGQRPESAETARGSRSSFERVPYLRHVAALVVLVSMGDTVIDYVLKATVANVYTTAGELVTFFAMFHTGIGLVAFALQAGVASGLLRQIGLTMTVGAWPLAVLIGGPVALVAPGLWSAIGLRGGAAVLEHSLYRSGYELMYTPLPPERKRTVKAFIDVGCEKLGSVVGGGLALGAVFATPESATPVLLAVALVSAAGCIVLLPLLNRGYVGALSSSLMSGAVRLEERDVRDSTTRRTLADTTIALDRRGVLAEIERLRRQRALDVMRRVRDGEPLGTDSVGDVLPLLADDEHASDVLAALRGRAEAASGTLLAALADDGIEVAVRRRIPLVLRSVPTQTVVDGLIGALTSEVFAIRYRCAIALRRVVEKNDSLEIDENAVFAAVQREGATDPDLLQEERLAEDEFDDDSAFRDPSLGRRLGRRLAYVFTLLSLVREEQPLEVAFNALASDDDAMRGTALEYLDNLLPRATRDAVWPLLGDRRVARHAARPRRQILEELSASSDQLRIGPRKPRGER